MLEAASKTRIFDALSNRSRTEEKSLSRTSVLQTRAPMFYLLSQLFVQQDY